MNKLIIGSIAAVAAGAGSIAIAQVAPAPMAAHSGHGMDRNHTRAEVAAKVRSHFERLDTNKDGFLTQTEASAGGTMMGERMKGMSPADHDAMFDRLDANKNGQISRAEFAAAHKGMMAMHGGKGKHGGAMGMRGMGGMRLHGEMFAMADANKDNRVSLAEATDAATRRFDMADVNRDGTLTPDERRQMHQKMMQTMRAPKAS